MDEVPFYELLVVDSFISEMINRSAPRQEVLHTSMHKGMFTLAQEALMRVYTGYLDFESLAATSLGPDYSTGVIFHEDADLQAFIRQR